MAAVAAAVVDLPQPINLNLQGQAIRNNNLSHQLHNSQAHNSLSRVFSLRLVMIPV